MNNNIFLDINSSKINIDSINYVFANHFGAVFSFIGVVRNINDNKNVKFIEYFIFEKLAKSLLDNKCKSLIDFNDIKISISQRYGVLYVGEINLIVSVGSINRNISFYICNLIVEYIKHDVPVWKKEYYEDNTYKWINSL